MKQYNENEKQPLSNHVVSNGVAYSSQVSTRDFKVLEGQRQGGTGRSNRLVNVQAQMEQVERNVIDVIDFRILRKSGALRR
jgi:hypothetical protein